MNGVRLAHAHDISLARMMTGPIILLFFFFFYETVLSREHSGKVQYKKNASATFISEESP